MKIVSRKYNNIEVIFDNSDSLYINATQIAKHFNKQASKWLENKDTKAYINALVRKQYFANDELVVIKQGGNAQEQGTWIHKKLIIAFARWLSPDFAVWCDGVIEEILQTGSYSVEKPFSRKEEVESQLVGLEFTFKHLRPSEASKIGMTKTLFEKIGLETSYLPEYSDEEHTFSAKTLLEKFEIKISVQQFNKKMISAGFLETKTRKSSKYRTEKDVDGKEVKIPILKEFKSLTEKGLQFGKNMISPKNQLESQPHYFENKFSELLKILQI
jgi:ribosomal protein L7/L12